MFVVAPTVSALRGPDLDLMVAHQSWAWFYGVNIYIALQGGWDLTYLNHLWSLSIEEQFYLLWAPTVFVFAPLPKLLLRTCLAIALVSALLRLAGSAMGLNWWTTYTMTPFRLDGLAVGAALAMMVRQPCGPARLARMLPLAAVILASLLALTIILPHFGLGRKSAALLSFRATLITVLLACLLVRAICSPQQSATSRFFRSRTMVSLGTYSYGIYLYHHFISHYFDSHHTSSTLAHAIGSKWAALALQTAVGVSVSLLLAYLSYEFFEKRFLRLKPRFCSSLADRDLADPIQRRTAWRSVKG